MVGESKTADDLEIISSGDQPLAYIIRNRFLPQRTTFVTQPEFKQQLGYIVYPAGAVIPRHVHLPLKREIVGTSEVILIRQGRCEVEIYTDQKELVATRELAAGDIVLMVNGGHGFRMIEDTVLLEVKQGPYTGLDEKERF